MKISWKQRLISLFFVLVALGAISLVGYYAGLPTRAIAEDSILIVPDGVPPTATHSLRPGPRRPADAYPPPV